MILTKPNVSSKLLITDCRSGVYSHWTLQIVKWMRAGFHSEGVGTWVQRWQTLRCRSTPPRPDAAPPGEDNACAASPQQNSENLFSGLWGLEQKQQLRIDTSTIMRRVNGWRYLCADAEQTGGCDELGCCWEFQKSLFWQMKLDQAELRLWDQNLGLCAAFYMKTWLQTLLVVQVKSSAHPRCRPIWFCMLLLVLSSKEMGKKKKKRSVTSKLHFKNQII